MACKLRCLLLQAVQSLGRHPPAWGPGSSAQDFLKDAAVGHVVIVDQHAQTSQQLPLSRTRTGLVLRNAKSCRWVF